MHAKPAGFALIKVERRSTVWPRFEPQLDGASRLRRTRAAAVRAVFSLVATSADLADRT